MTFIDELLAESEVREKEVRIQMNKLKADQILAALAVLEQKAEEVNKLADDEIGIIEEYRQVELQKIEKKASWFAYQLEQFIRSTDEKTINLPHGAIKLRLGRDKIEIVNLDEFIPFAQRKNLLKQVPESFEPDLTKLKEYLQRNKFAPPGVVLTPAQTKFSYTTKGKDNGETEQSEIGTQAE
jgi:hypothetical protein